MGGYEVFGVAVEDSMPDPKHPDEHIVWVKLPDVGLEAERDERRKAEARRGFQKSVLNPILRKWMEDNGLEYVEPTWERRLPILP